MSTKRKEVIIDKIFKHWIALFGTPKYFCQIMVESLTMTFFCEMREQLNINMETTGAESPWSNMVVEKHSRIIGNMMEHFCLMLDAV